MENDSPPLAPLDAALAVSDALPLSDAALDAHGFDPGDYDWVPIPRRHRTDGWTHAQQRAFIEALADLGSVRKAAFEVRMSARSAYALRRAPGAEGFAAAWDAAIAQALRADILTSAAAFRTEPKSARASIKARCCACVQPSVLCLRGMGTQS